MHTSKIFSLVLFYHRIKKKYNKKGKKIYKLFQTTPSYHSLKITCMVCCTKIMLDIVNILYVVIAKGLSNSLDKRKK